MLLEIYAKCIDGDDELYRARIDAALGRGPAGAKLPGAVGGRTDESAPQLRFRR